jgi:DnaJ-class molecular chaperone
MAKNYYAILDVTPSATADEVRASHRRLAKEFHPDHYAGNRQIFQEVQEAYAVLGHPWRRSQYEKRITKAPLKQPEKPVPGFEPDSVIAEQAPVDMGAISPVRSFQTFTPSFDEIFDWLWANFASLDQPKSGRVKNLTLEILLSAEQALCGGNARVMVPARAFCPTCHGCGAVGAYECLRCAGEGAISGEMPLWVAFPPGLAKDHAVMIPLDRFGVKNLHLTILFRPTGADEAQQGC